MTEGDAPKNPLQVMPFRLLFVRTFASCRLSVCLFKKECRSCQTAERYGNSLVINARNTSTYARSYP